MSQCKFPICLVSPLSSNPLTSEQSSSLASLKTATTETAAATRTAAITRHPAPAATLASLMAKAFARNAENMTSKTYTLSPTRTDPTKPSHRPATRTPQDTKPILRVVTIVRSGERPQLSLMSPRATMPSASLSSSPNPPTTSSNNSSSTAKATRRGRTSRTLYRRLLSPAMSLRRPQCLARPAF